MKKMLQPRQTCHRTWTGGDDGTNTDLEDRIRVDGRPDSDRWFLWAAIDPDGQLHVIYMDGRPSATCMT